MPAPLPPFLAPQLATPRAAAPDGPEWLHEIKFDGYRTLARLENGAVRLLTRNGHDWSDRYGDLGAAFEALPSRQALIDGEIIVQDEHGVSSFAALQEALTQRATHCLLFYAFDLLHLDGFACQRSLEGIVSKQLDAPYQSGRTRSWCKVKCVNTDDFVIVGVSQSEAAGGLAALLLAEPRNGTLTYVGKVGTGFSAKTADDLRARLEAFARASASLAVPKDADTRNVTWTEPKLMAEVRYGTRTAEGRLRQASFLGLRQDRTWPPDVPKPEPREPSPSRRRLVSDEDLAAIWVTNPVRVMFGAGGPTKLQLALYYASVGDWMLPELLRRPVSLVRCPTGEQDSCFFQRHASPGMPPSVKSISLEGAAEEHAEYIFIDDARGFLGLCQFGTVEFHPWGCRVDEPVRPDRMIFDLDPDEDLRWRDVVDASFHVRDALAALGLKSFVKTTGGKGVHIIVPLVRQDTWDTVFRFSRVFVERLAASAPQRFTANMAKRSRRGRVFVDYHRN